MFSAITTTIADALFPLSCIGCGAADTMLCTDCQAIAAEPITSLCPQCLDHPSDGGVLCASCSNESAVQGIVAGASYRNPITRAAIERMKFDGVRAMIPSLSDLLADALAGSRAPRDHCAIAPIPLHHRRARERGFDQSLLLATALSKTFDVPLVTPLDRTRSRPPQQTLGLKRRASNIRGAFAAHPAPEHPPALLLVDDIMTSGATLEEAAQTLRRAGWPTVWGAVVARTPKRRRSSTID